MRYAFHHQPSTNKRRRVYQACHRNFLNGTFDLEQKGPLLHETAAGLRNSTEDAIDDIVRAEGLAATQRNWLEALNGAHENLVAAREESEQLQQELQAARRRVRPPRILMFVD